jgi:hypothetical protein
MIQGLPQFTDILSSFLLSNLNENVQNFKVVQNVSADNPTRKFLTNRIAAFFKFGPIKLIYSEKTPSRVKKQPAE